MWENCTVTELFLNYLLQQKSTNNTSEKVLVNNPIGEKSIRLKFQSADIPFGENCAWRKFHSAKNTFVENSGDKKFRGENSPGENS